MAVGAKLQRCGGATDSGFGGGAKGRQSGAQTTAVWGTTDSGLNRKFIFLWMSGCPLQKPLANG